MATILLLLCGIPLVLTYIYVWPVALKLARGEKLEEIMSTITTVEATEAETAELTAAGWTPDLAGGRTHWLHEEHAPVLGVSTRVALERHHRAVFRKSAASIDGAVMERLRAPFSYSFISSRAGLGRPDPLGRWRIADANDDAIASCSAQEEGYAHLIVQALNDHFVPRAARPTEELLVLLTDLHKGIQLPHPSERSWFIEEVEKAIALVKGLP
jgi:hypothetical protein